MLLELRIPSPFLSNPCSQIPAKRGGTFGKSLGYRVGNGVAVPEAKRYEGWQKLKGGEPSNDTSSVQVNVAEARVGVHLLLTVRGY